MIKNVNSIVFVKNLGQNKQNAYQKNLEKTSL